MSNAPFYTNLGTIAVDAGNLNAINLAIYQLLGDGNNAPISRAQILTNLGIGSAATLGTMSQQNASAVAITGGTISGVPITGLTGVLPVANGGTGSTLSPVMSAAFTTASLALTSGALTVVPYNTKDFDTGGFLNASTGVFTPTVAGYYQVSAALVCTIGSAFSSAVFSIFKNGVEWQRFFQLGSSAAIVAVDGSGSCLIFCNGTTDFIDVRVNITGTTPALVGGFGSRFTAAFIHA